MFQMRPCASAIRRDQLAMRLDTCETRRRALYWADCRGCWQRKAGKILVKSNVADGSAEWPFHRIRQTPSAGWPGQVQCSHLRDIAHREAAFKASGKIRDKPRSVPRRITRPGFSTLFMRDDAATDLPYCRRHKGIDRAGRSSAGGIQMSAMLSTKWP